MKLNAAYVYLLFPALLLILPGTRLNLKSRQKHDKLLQVVKSGNETGTDWGVKEYYYSKNNKSLQTIKKRGRIFMGRTSGGISFLNMGEIKNIVEYGDTIVVGMDFNDKYAAYSVMPAWRNYQLKHELFISKLKVSGGDVKFEKVREFAIPFSQSITGIKFLNKNSLLLTSYLEYAIVKIIPGSGGKFGISIKHYPFLPYTIDSRLSITSSLNGKNIFIYGGTGVCMLKRFNNNSYGLQKLFYLDLSVKYNRTDESSIEHIAMIDTAFGAFICYNKLIYYLRNPETGNPAFVTRKFIHYGGKDSISAKSIVDIKAYGHNSFYCMTSNGLILRQTINKYNFSAEKWNLVKKIPVIEPYSMTIINKDSIIVACSDKLLLVYKISRKIENVLSSKLKNYPYFIIENLAQPSTSYGIGIGDLECKGTDDIYIVDVYDRNKFFTSVPNLLNNSFPDNISMQRGIGGRTEITGKKNLTFDLDLGTAIGDINDDGAEDLIVTNLAYSNSLYLNNGKGYFQDATNEFNFNVNMWRSEGAVLADVNNDGYLDVFCTSFFKSNRLFINNHGVSFNDGTKKAGLESNGRSISATFGDVNNDGYPDLYVDNWMKGNKLYFNNGKGKFIDHTKQSGVGGGNFKESNSVFFADLNNDGYLDLFVGNRAGGDKLYLNNGDGTFRDITRESGLDEDAHTYGAVFGDFDNDGWQDIALACLGGIKIFKNMGADNKGNLHFQDITDKAIVPGIVFKSYSTGLATAYFGSKGFLDLVMTQNEGYTYFFLNKERLNGSNNYLSVKVEGDESCRDAIGAKLRLFYKDSLIGYREVSGGYGYASSSSKIQHFGLGSLHNHLTLTVYFPASHITRRISVLPNTFITVTENKGFKRNYFLTEKAFLRFFYGKGFIILGFEVIILSIIFSLFVAFIAEKLRLNKSHSSKMYFNAKLIILSLFVFYIMKLFTVESMSFYFGPAYFILNSKNFFTDEILPVLTSCAFAASVLLVIKNRETKSAAGYNIPENLLMILKRFGHGEGMLIILHRLSLLVENYNPKGDEESSYDIESVSRINSAFSEYKGAVVPEIKKIYGLIDQLDVKTFNNMDRAKLSNYSNSMLQNIAQISNCCEQIIHGRQNNNRLKAKSETVASIKNLRDELTGIRRIVQSYFAINVSREIDTAINKFKEQNPELIIIHDKINENINAVISSSDFNEVINIIIQNAVDEITQNNINEGKILIQSSHEGDKVIIKIEDNGNGIHPENLDKIFSEGFTTKSSGHGIGLSIVRKCLDKFEGEISAGKGPLGGALFILKLKPE